jgi:hypothetical protein
MTTKISEMWNEYAAKCLPEVTPDTIQYKETKKAFYAAAIGMFENMKYISARYVEEQALEKFNEIENEGAEYMRQFIIANLPKQ